MQALTKKLRLDTLIRYGIAAILIAVPLYPKFPFLNVPGIYVSIRIEDFLILIVSILWLINNIPNLLNLWKNAIVRAITIFLVTSLLATVSGIIFLHTSSSLIGILEWGRRVEYFMGFFIALRYVQGGHLASTFAGHYDMATYIILTSPIFIALLFIKNGTRNFRLLIIAILAMSFWLMVNAASRISAVSYVAALSITLFLIRKYKYIPIIVIITIIFAFTTSNLFDRYLNIFDVIKKKLLGLIPDAYAQNVTNPSGTDAPVAAAPILEDRSTSIRLAVEWPRAVRAFLKNPLLGTGYASTTLATDNDYLRALGETGILGFISMFFVYFRIIKEFLMKSWPKGILSKKEIDFRTVYLAGIIGAIPGVLLNAVFIDVFEASKFAITFWFMLGFGIALIIHEKNQKTY